MVGKYKVITLCGSTRFKEEFIKAQKDLTLQGNIIISVGLFGHSGDNEVWTDDTKEMLDDMHKRKIDMADEIFVINVNGYIGESTKSEIEYAKRNGKIVRYLQEVDSDMLTFIRRGEELGNGYYRGRPLSKGDEIMVYGTEKVTLGYKYRNLNNIVTEIIYQPKPWWKFWQKKQQLGFKVRWL